MFVRMWMNDNLVTVGPDAPLTEAADLMAHHHIRRLPVVDSTAGRTELAGIISASDVLRAAPPEVNPFSVLARDTIEEGARRAHQKVETVGHIMHRDPVVTTPDAPIESAARLMRDRKIGALPVVRDGALVGLITESDIFRAFVTMLESEHGARLTFDISKGEDPFPFVAELAQRHGLHVHSYNTNHYGRSTVCVVQVVGPDARISDMIETVWSSRHRVLHVARML